MTPHQKQSLPYWHWERAMNARHRWSGETTTDARRRSVGKTEIQGSRCRPSWTHRRPLVAGIMQTGRRRSGPPASARSPGISRHRPAQTDSMKDLIGHEQEPPPRVDRPNPYPPNRATPPLEGTGHVPISSQHVPQNPATPPPDHQRQGKKVIPGPATKSPTFGNPLNVAGGIVNGVLAR